MSEVQNALKNGGMEISMQKRRGYTQPMMAKLREIQKRNAKKARMRIVNDYAGTAKAYGLFVAIVVVVSVVQAFAGG